MFIAVFIDEQDVSSLDILNICRSRYNGHQVLTFSELIVALLLLQYLSKKLLSHFLSRGSGYKISLQRLHWIYLFRFNTAVSISRTGINISAI